MPDSKRRVCRSDPAPKDRLLTAQGIPRRALPDALRRFFSARIARRFRVYVDTSVIGGCFDPEFAAWSRLLVEDFRRRRLRPVVSDVVSMEVDLAPPNVRSQYDALVSWDFRHLVRVDKVRAFNAVNARLGVPPVTIASPREVTFYGET